MPTQVRLTDGTLLTVTDQPFKEGGEGGLFHIIGSSTHQQEVVKLYHPDKRTPDRERKLAYLIANSPNLTAINGHQSVIWPLQIAYQNNQFAGFTMPLAKGEALELLCHNKLAPKLGTEWQRFSPQSSDAQKLRLNVCFNIAVALQQIHSQGRYVLVDMKPGNILVQSKTLTHVIDIDSVQIRQNSQLLFASPVATPDYAPPEYYRGLDLVKTGTADTWDRFSLAVIFYQLLLGLHPFTGTCHPPFDTCNGQADMIAKGLFPHSPTMSRHFRVVPPPHQDFLRLPQPVRELFIRCFDAGHLNPNQRPTAEDWCRALAPPPVIDLKRALPSASVKLLDFKPSTSLAFPQLNWPPLPSVSYLAIPRMTTLKHIIYGIFGKSQREGWRERLILQQEKAKKQEAEVQALYASLQGDNADFHLAQGEILRHESATFSSLQANFTNKLTTIEKQARTLYELEMRSLKETQNELNKQLTAIETRMKAFNQHQIQPVVDGYETRRASIQNQLTSVQEAENQESRQVNLTVQQQINQFDQRLNSLRDNYGAKIDREFGLDNRLQLINRLKERYVIANLTSDIFGMNPATAVNNLTKCKIKSAADFTDAPSPSGEIKLTNGNWIKVAQVGPDRVGRLRVWLKKVEKECKQKIAKLEQIASVQKNQIPALMAQVAEAERQKQAVRQQSQRQQEIIRQKYVNQKKSLDQQLLKLQGEHDAAISSLRMQLDKLMKESAAQQAIHQSDYERSRQKLTQFYDQAHQALQKEVTDTVLFMKMEINKCNASTQTRLRENLNYFSQQSRQKHQSVQSLLSGLTTEIGILQELQMQYGQIAK